MGGMEGIEGERKEQQSDRAENQHQNGLDLGSCEVQKVICSIKNALWLYSELCFLCGRGAHFQKVHEKMLPESEKWSQIMSDTLKYHANGVGYMKMASKLCRIYH